MKYVLMFVDEGGKPGPETYEKIMSWFGEHSAAGRIVGGRELQGAESATTVRFHNGKPIVSDGPYIETKESIGGWAEVEVPDLDAALEMAKSWPAGTVEVRPVLVHEG
jgi:hypothetical protein